MPKIKDELGRGLKYMLDKMHEHEGMRKEGAYNVISYKGKAYMIMIKEYTIEGDNKHDK